MKLHKASRDSDFMTMTLVSYLQCKNIDRVALTLSIVGCDCFVIHYFAYGLQNQDENAQVAHNFAPCSESILGIFH
jgi:hypothetical protein